MYINIETIYSGISSRNIENVKYQVWEALAQLSLLTAGIRINRISDTFDSVFSGYKLSDVETKYLMQPYCGLSFSLEIYIRNNIC